MRRKYRIKHLNRKPKSSGHDTPINKTVSELIRNQAFKSQVRKFCAETGKTYMTVIGIVMALGEGCKKGRGTTTIGQIKIAEKIGVHKDTVNDYMKGMEAYGIISLWGRTRNASKTNNVQWRTTSLTIITCLFEFAERCAYWYRSAINQKNIAAEKAKTLAKSLIGVKPMHSCSFHTVDVKTGEISEDKHTIKGKHEDWLTEYSSLET